MIWAARPGETKYIIMIPNLSKLKQFEILSRINIIVIVKMVTCFWIVSLNETVFRRDSYRREGSFLWKLVTYCSYMSLYPIRYTSFFVVFFFVLSCKSYRSHAFMCTSWPCKTRVKLIGPKQRNIVKLKPCASFTEHVVIQICRGACVSEISLIAASLG